MVIWHWLPVRNLYELIFAHAFLKTTCFNKQIVDKQFFCYFINITLVLTFSMLETKKYITTHFLLFIIIIFWYKTKTNRILYFSTTFSNAHVVIVYLRFWISCFFGCLNLIFFMYILASFNNEIIVIFQIIVFHYD
jgi:hypothetical protein